MFGGGHVTRNHDFATSVEEIPGSSHLVTTGHRDCLTFITTCENGNYQVTSGAKHIVTRNVRNEARFDGVISDIHLNFQPDLMSPISC